MVRERLVREGSIGGRILSSLLEGGKSGVKIGLDIIPGVLIICSVVMLLTFSEPAGGYTGGAYEGVAFLPWVGEKLSFILTPLFGFSSPESISVPIMSLGAAGAAISVVPRLVSEGLAHANDIAVFTAICMCWSGYLSTHIAMLEEMNKKGDFSYVGRKDESTEKFYNGDCAMTTASSGSLANIREYAKFNYGVGMMPYDADAKDAPQNAIIGGASLWVMQGKNKETYTGVAKFLDFLAKPENAAEWHQKTGYLPITKAAYDLTREQGFYEKNPGADTATRQMLNKPPLPFTKGLRLGNMPQIRVIVDEELESVWTGKKTPQQALDTAVERGNQLLRRFEKSTKS